MAISNCLMDKQTIKEIGHELWKMRREKHLRLHQVENQTHIPASIIDKMELGRFLQFIAVRKLMAFYGKKMKIVFEDE